MGSDSFPELLIRADRSSHFSLYWMTNLVRLAGLSESDLTNQARSEVEFLKSLKNRALSCSDIIDAEGDPAALERLLKSVKSASASQTSQALDTPYSSNTPRSNNTSNPLSPKRQRVEGSSDNIANPTVQAELASEGNRALQLKGRPKNGGYIFVSLKARMMPSCNGSKYSSRMTFLAHGLGHGITVLEKENLEPKKEVEVNRVPELSKEVEVLSLKVKDLEITD
ncbi:DUF4102 domain-containing protein [Sesbania bispinosa]|nr:DUF4102 domain-containing protein [Sesbania bispinosa]